MMNRKIALTLAGLLAANAAAAVPAFSDDAPQSSVDTCIAAVARNADYVDASSVIHNVETRERRVSGFRMSIRTIVYGEGETVIREYAAKCAIDDRDEIKRFRMHQTD